MALTDLGIGMDQYDRNARLKPALLVILPAAQKVKGVEIVGVCDASKGRVIRAQQRTGGRAKEYKE